MPPLREMWLTMKVPTYDASRIDVDNACACLVFPHPLPLPRPADENDEVNLHYFQLIDLDTG